jgi:FkbM family methyltransferase
MIDSQRRSLFELLGDAVSYSAVSVLRRRAAGHTDFPHIVVPIDDMLGLRIISTGRFELTQFDALRTVLENPRDILGVDINRQGTFVDIGANIGLYTIALAPLFGRTLAFEPNPVTFKVLEANLALCEVEARIFNVGLSDRNGDASFFVPKNGRIGWATLTERYNSHPAKETKVKLRTLDDVDAAEGNTTAVSLIKIDVEGHEPEVLQGAQRVLRRDGPVVLFEVLAGADGRACVETLRACGYSRFFNFKRTLAGNRGGITGYVESLLKGAPITISEIDVSALGHNALVCAVHD